MIIETRAYARAGLLGNPSDGYNGKCISVIVRNFGAHVQLYETPELCIESQSIDRNIFRSVYELVDTVSHTGYYGADRLIKAAIRVFTSWCENEGLRLSNRNFTIRYHSSIPRQVGLAGSSAIITATFRALMKFYEIDIPQPVLPSLVLASEVEELGINAGLQDRVIQTYEGCVYMDFARELFAKQGHGDYVPLDPNGLPKLYLAYKTSLSKVSGAVLNTVKQRYEAGDPTVIDTLREMAGLAEQGREAISGGDHDALYDLTNRNFDLRCKIMSISESNRQLVDTARACGASAKFSGSGGAIIGFYRDDAMLTRLNVELKKIDARVIRPILM